MTVHLSQFRYHTDGLGSALEMFFAPRLYPVLVAEAGLDAPHIEIAEMEQIQILGNMIVMTFDPMKTATPAQGLGNYARLGVAC